jgi:hypothetical protein
MRRIFVPALALFPALLLSSPPEDQKKSPADLVRLIRKAVEGGKEDEALALIRELGGTGAALKDLFDLGIKIQIPRLYHEVTAQLAARTDEEALKYFEAEARGSNEVRQIYLADVLAEMKAPRAVEIAGLLVEDKNPTVLRSAIATMGKLKVRGSVAPLLKLLERLEGTKDRGQVYQELRDALFALTGQDFEAVADWKKWWDINQGTFEPGKQVEGATQVRKAPRDSVPEFAGKKIFGKNVVFVIDTSGTMRFVQKDDIPGLGVVSKGRDSEKASGRVKEGSLTKENERLARFWGRMEMAKRALLKAIQGFDARARINVLEFNSKVKRLEKTLFSATPAAKKKAEDWVRKMKWIPNGNTNTMASLEEAFAVDGSVSEIYFLSDGIPSKDGTVNDPPGPILERVEALNRFRKVKIYTFGFDPKYLLKENGDQSKDLTQANEFLKTLAESTGGTFTELKVTDEKPPKEFK